MVRSDNLARISYRDYDHQMKFDRTFSLHKHDVAVNIPTFFFISNLYKRSGQGSLVAVWYLVVHT